MPDVLRKIKAGAAYQGTMVTTVQPTGPIGSGIYYRENAYNYTDDAIQVIASGLDNNFDDYTYYTA